MKAMESLENFANYVLAHWKEAPSHSRAGVLYRDARTEIKKLEAEKLEDQATLKTYRKELERLSAENKELLADLEARSESNVTLVRANQILLDKIDELTNLKEQFIER